MFKGIMTKKPVQNQTQSSTKHAKQQDVTDIFRTNYFGCFGGFFHFYVMLYLLKQVLHEMYHLGTVNDLSGTS